MEKGAISEHILSPLAGFAPGWAEALWQLEDCRHRTLAALAEVDPDMVDVVPAGLDNTIGSLLYHIALIEADWLYADILEIDYPAWMYERFPDEDRDANGHLVPASRALIEHIDTLSHVRQRLLMELKSLDSLELVRVRETGSGRLTPQWVLHHLCQHEAEHRGQIQSARTVLDG